MLQNTEEEPKRPQPHPPHRRYLSSSPAATLHGKTHGFVLRLPPHDIAHATVMQPFHCDLRFKKRIELRTQEQPLVAKHRGGTKTIAAAPAAHRRYLSSSPAATLHGKTRGFVLRLPPHNIAHATFMQPCHCDLQPEIQETQKTTHTGTTTCCKTQRRNQNDRSRNRHTQEVPFIVGCSHFTRKNARFRAPASSPQQSPCNTHAFCSILFITTSHRHHFPSSPLPIVTTSYRHHFPSSPLPFVTTSLSHHFPSSPLPIVTTSLGHHFPSSPLPVVTTSLPHHFPSSPLPIVTTSLSHHFPKSPLPSSPLPLVTTSLPHHFPSSPLPFLTTSLPHHFPSSPPPFLTTPLRHHFPSSPLPFVTTLSHSFLFLCYVLLLYVL